MNSLRRLADQGHEPSMVLLAVLLGDIDSKIYREEIISLNEKAFASGSPVAAENMAIQYGQWGETFMSRLWRKRAQ